MRIATQISCVKSHAFILDIRDMFGEIVDLLKGQQDAYVAELATQFGLA